MELTLKMYGLLSIISFIGGIISAITGGSGMIVLPSLLMAGVAPHIALGTNKLFTTSGLLTSSMTFIRKSYFHPRIWLAVAIAALAGGVIGAVIALFIPNNSLQRIIPILLLLMTIYFMLPKRGIVDARRAMPPDSIVAKLIALTLGIYSGFLGAGTGTIWTAVSMQLFGNDIVKASAMSRFMCFVTNIAALIVFMLLRNVSYQLGLSLIVMGVLGAYIGTHLAISFGKKLIRPALLIVTTTMTLILIGKSWL